MELNWNAPLVNGIARSPFFSYASYVKYSVPPETTVTADQKNQLQQKFSDSATDSSYLGKNEPHEKGSDSQSTGSRGTSAGEHRMHNTGGGIGVCLNLKVPYPRPSVFTHEEQRLYLELKQKFSDMAPTSAEDMKQLNFLNELHKRVVEEQEEYMKYLESVAHRCADDYSFITPEAVKFVEDWISCRRCTVLKYPRFYTMLDTVSLVPPTRLNSSLNLCHHQKLLEMGIVPKVILPKTDFNRKRQKMTLDSVKFAQCYPTKGDSNNSSYGKQPHVSEDQNAERLAIKYGAHIVISSSSLQCLIDNQAPQFPRQWEMPVVVKEHSSSAGVDKRRIVYVDKPFISKSFSNHDKNVLYHHLAFKTTVLHPSHMSSYSLETNRSANLNDSLETDEAVGTADRNIFDDASAGLEDLETFGTGSRRIVREDLTSHNKNTSCKKFGRNASQQSNSLEPSRERGSAAAADVKSDAITTSESSNRGLSRNVEESLSTDDDDSHLAIDLDRPLSPIVSTDGQFDKKEETASGGPVTRQSRRLAEKRERPSTSNDGSSPAEKRLMPDDPSRGDSCATAVTQPGGSSVTGTSADGETNRSLTRRSAIERQLRSSVSSAGASAGTKASGCANSVLRTDGLQDQTANGSSLSATPPDCLPTPSAEAHQVSSPAADVCAEGRSACQLQEPSLVRSSSVPGRLKRSVTSKKVPNAEVPIKPSADVNDEQCTTELTSSDATAGGRTFDELQLLSPAVTAARSSDVGRRTRSVSSTLSNTVSNVKAAMMSPTDVSDERFPSVMPSADISGGGQTCDQVQQSSSTASLAVSTRKRSFSCENTSDATDGSGERERSCVEGQTSCPFQVSSPVASATVPLKRRRSTSSAISTATANSRAPMMSSVNSKDESCTVELPSVVAFCEGPPQCTSPVASPSVRTRRNRSVSSMNSSDTTALLTPSADASDKQCLAVSCDISTSQLRTAGGEIGGRFELSSPVANSSIPEKRKRSVPLKNRSDSKARTTSSATTNDEQCSVGVLSSACSAESQTVCQWQESSPMTSSSVPSSVSTKRRRSASLTTSKTVSNTKAYLTSPANAKESDQPPVSSMKNLSAPIDDSLDSRMPASASDAETKDCDRCNSERVTEVEIKRESSPVDMATYAATTEVVTVTGGERSSSWSTSSPAATETIREPKLPVLEEPKLSVLNTASSVCQDVSVSAASSPAVCSTAVRESHPTTTHSGGDNYSVGRRRIARIPLGSSRPTTPSASAADSRSTVLRATPGVDDGRPKRPVASAGDGRLAVSHVGSSVDDALTKPSPSASMSSSAASEQRSCASGPTDNKLAGSSTAFQSPLDQILVDQRRMFEQTASHNVATSRVPANGQQFVLHPIPQQKKLLPIDAVAPVAQAASPPPAQPVIESVSRTDVTSSTVRTVSSSASVEALETLQSSDKTQTSSSMLKESRSSTASGASPTESVNSGLNEDQAVNCEDPNEYTRFHKSNVIYDLWTLGSLKILVRHSYHGVYSPFRRKQCFVHLMSKLEYQLQHGVEQLTYGEAVRSWLALHLRPNARVIRARIDPLKSELAVIDEWDMVKFFKELPAFHPGLVVNVLNTVFERLVKLEPGCHLINHMPGNTHAQIKKMTKSQSGVYDLHLAYQAAGEIHKSSATQGVPWMPINTNFLLPYHIKFGRIPGTFEPKDTARINTVRSNTSLNNAKKINKKKKKPSAH